MNYLEVDVKEFFLIGPLVKTLEANNRTFFRMLTRRHVNQTEILSNLDQLLKGEGVIMIYADNQMRQYVSRTRDHEDINNFSPRHLVYSLELPDEIVEKLEMERNFNRHSKCEIKLTLPKDFSVLEYASIKACIFDDQVTCLNIEKIEKTVEAARLQFNK